MAQRSARKICPAPKTWNSSAQYMFMLRAQFVSHSWHSHSSLQQTYRFRLSWVLYEKQEARFTTDGTRSTGRTWWSAGWGVGSRKSNYVNYNTPPGNIQFVVIMEGPGPPPHTHTHTHTHKLVRSQTKLRDARSKKLGSTILKAAWVKSGPIISGFIHAILPLRLE